MKKLLFVAAFGVAMCAAVSCDSATKHFNSWFGSDSVAADTVAGDSVDTTMIDTLAVDSAVVDTVVADSTK